MIGEGSPVRYGAWARDRQGWFLGLGLGAWTVIVAGGAPLLAAAGVHRWSWAAGWTPFWVLLIALVSVPVRGRPAARWCADLALRWLGGVAGWSDWQSRAAAGTATDPDVADLPGVLAGIRTHDGPPYGPMLTRPVVVSDDRARTWAVVARIEHPGIGLTETSARARLGAGLAELLEGITTSELVSLLALQVRTVPDDGAERAEWQRAHLRADAPELALAATDELTGLMIQAAVRHETFLTVVVPESRIGRTAREAGGGVDGRAHVLHGLMGEIEGRLTGSLGVTSVSWLESSGLAAAIRTGFAPADRAHLVAAELAGRRDPRVAGLLPMAAAGPTSAPPPEHRWYAHDAWTTATCTVLLPDKGAVMGALAPVLAPTVAGERRCLTVFFEPIAAGRADRIVGADAMSADLAAELRRRGGFRTRAAHTRDEARVHGQDVHLAEGNALVRVGLAAAVTVPASWSITDFARRLEAAITTSGFTPLRLDLAQDSGFAAACIPLGIGLPRRRGAR